MSGERPHRLSFEKARDPSTLRSQVGRGHVWWGSGDLPAKPWHDKILGCMYDACIESTVYVYDPENNCILFLICLDVQEVK